MRLLLCASKSPGSNIMFSRLIKRLGNTHDIRICAFYNNHQFLDTIDYTLDPFFINSSFYFKKRFGIKGVRVNYNLADFLFNDLLEWQPDLIINDCEIFTATLANILEIPIWYCSPLLQSIGFDVGMSALTDNLISYNIGFPQAQKYLIYSPLADVENRPEVKNGFTLIRPYFEEIDQLTTECIDNSLVKKATNENVTTGETSFVADCIYSEQPFYISPNPNNQEQMINARLCYYYGVGVNIGRSNNPSFLKEQVEKIYYPKLKINNIKTLDEEINESSI